MKQCFGRKIRQYLDGPTCQTTQRSENKESQLKLACADPESFVRGGPTKTTFFNCFLVGERGEDPGNTISGPISARQQNAIKWRFAGVLMMAEH